MFLCASHNEQLSALDFEALKFFSALRYEMESDSIDADGHLLERWYLKVEG